MVNVLCVVQVFGFKGYELLCYFLMLTDGPDQLGFAKCCSANRETYVKLSISMPHDKVQVLNLYYPMNFFLSDVSCFALLLLFYSGYNVFDF